MPNPEDLDPELVAFKVERPQVVALDGELLATLAADRLLAIVVALCSFFRWVAADVLFYAVVAGGVISWWGAFRSNRGAKLSSARDKFTSYLLAFWVMAAVYVALYFFVKRKA